MNVFARRRLRVGYSSPLSGGKVFRRDVLGFRLRCTPAPGPQLDDFTRRALALLRRPEGPRV